MQRFIQAGRRAIADNNWYAGLTLALMIPEICASLEDPGPGKSARRYTEWCRKWLEPKFTYRVGPEGIVTVFLSAEDLYQARCSVIHSGTAEIDPKKRTGLDRFEFFEGGPHMNKVAESEIDGVLQPSYLQLRVDMFSETVFRAAEEWEIAVANDANVQAQKESLLVIRKPGVMLGGIFWG